MSTQFIPNGSTFIGNVVPGTQYSANLIANAPTTYVRINNFGDGTGNTFGSIWCLVTSNTAPQVVDFSSAADPNWAASQNGTLVLQGEPVILAINNNQGSKRAIELQFVANVDPTSGSAFNTITVQPVAPA